MSSPLDRIPLDPVKESLYDLPYRAKRAYVLFLQGLFRSRPEGMYQWRPNEETEIRITGGYPIDLDKNEQRPAIVVERTEGRWSGVSQTGVATESLLEGTRTHADMMSSAMIIHCIARNGEVASGIAWWVFRWTPVFHGVLQKWGGIQSVSLQLTLGKQSDPGQIVSGSSFPEVIDVPVTSPFFLGVSTRYAKAQDSDFQSIARDITMTMESGLGLPTAATERRSKAEGPVKDVSRELVGDELILRPPSFGGKTLRRTGSLDPVHHESERSRPLETTTSLDP